jgi:hypothetical protein
MPYLIGAAAIFLLGGGVFAAGEGVDKASNAALKLTIAAGAAYLIYKKVK